ncbi:MAG: hypothetical protein L6R39_007695, partial [Caloplaca ligustica]
GDCEVRLRTGTMGVVDDIEEVEEHVRRKAKRKGRGKGDGGKKVKADGEEGDVEMKEEQADGEEFPETQIRKVSVLEVAITLK